MFFRRSTALDFSSGVQHTGRLEYISASHKLRLTPTGHPPSERNSIVADATWETICAHRGLKPTAKLRRRAAAGFASTPRLPPHNRTASDQCRQAGWLAPIRSSVSKLPALASLLHDRVLCESGSDRKSVV